MTVAFQTVILDVDSTLCGIEGIDWLGARRGPDVGRRVVELTDRAMRGEIPLESVYGERLAIIRPTREEIGALAVAYAEAIAPGAEPLVGDLHRLGVRVVLLSGGIRQAIVPLATRLGVLDTNLHAVPLRFTPSGEFAGVEPSPLTGQDGKPTIAAAALAAKRWSRPVLAVGDGSTDALLRGVVDRFVAFTGFVRRDAVVVAADLEVASFASLAEVVLA